MSKPNLLAIQAKYERGHAATNEELGHLLSRLEQAEQAMQRARELSWYLKKLSPGDQHYAKLIDRALDGETRADV